MEAESPRDLTDILTLRFEGQERDGTALHELRAAHVAEVLQGLVGISSDFAKAGVFGDSPFDTEVLVRPPQRGSFLIEVVRVVQENWDTVVLGGMPTLGQVIWWATRSARADVKDFEYLDDDKVKVTWQDDTAQEVPLPAWRELQKREPRRKKQLRQILAPLRDERVSTVEVQSNRAPDDEAVEPRETFTLSRRDYNAVRPDEEIHESFSIFETEAQMSAIDFDNPTRWRVKTADTTRAATVEDQVFLGRIANGLAVRKSDIFRLTVRQDTVEKNGRTRRTWTVLNVEAYRRAADDNS